MERLPSGPTFQPVALLPTPSDANGDPVSEAFTVSGDGSTFAGSGLRRPVSLRRQRLAPRTQFRDSGILPRHSRESPHWSLRVLAVTAASWSDSAESPWLDSVYGPFIWTKELGTVNLDDFVRLRVAILGTAYPVVPDAISADGSTIGRSDRFTPGYTGWVLQLKCARLPCRLGGGKFQTLSVDFPKATSTSTWPTATPQAPVSNS